jgi:replication initiation protein RepC
MHTRVSTTPFGRRPLSLAMVATQAAARATEPGAAVHKWLVYRAICEAKVALGIGDRALAVLNALLTFHPETVLTAAASKNDDGDRQQASGLVVFPSNDRLSLRAHGMAPATLRRHLAVLVHCGLLIRRDSPNGKRYARKGQGGAIESAFGFDLMPLVARAAEFERLAQAARTERRDYLVVRERITLVRRDIAKMIATGVEEGVSGDWGGFQQTYSTLARSIPRTATKAELEPLMAALEALAEEIRIVLESHINPQNQNANESQTERHIQNSNTNPSESEPALQKSRRSGGAPRESPTRHKIELSTEKQTTRTAQRRQFPLGMVLEACPDVSHYARHGIASWRDLVVTAELVRSVLGVSPSAWEDACSILGEEDAAIVVAAILQRAEAIKSPGGYLRNLTERARAGEFSVGPVLMSLLRKRTTMDRNVS